MLLIDVRFRTDRDRGRFLTRERIARRASLDLVRHRGCRCFAHRSARAPREAWRTHSVDIVASVGELNTVGLASFASLRRRARVFPRAKKPYRCGDTSFARSYPCLTAACPSSPPRPRPGSASAPSSALSTPPGRCAASTLPRGPRPPDPSPTAPSPCTSPPSDPSPVVRWTAARARAPTHRATISITPDVPNATTFLTSVPRPDRPVPSRPRQDAPAVMRNQSWPRSPRRAA